MSCQSVLVAVAIVALVVLAAVQRDSAFLLNAAAFVGITALVIGVLRWKGRTMSAKLILAVAIPALLGSSLVLYFGLLGVPSGWWWVVPVWVAYLGATAVWVYLHAE